MTKGITYALVVLGILVLSVFGLRTWHNNAISKAVEAARSDVKQDYTHTYVEGLKSSLEASNNLLVKHQQAAKELQDEKTNIIRSRDVAIERLRQRATRAEAEIVRSNSDVASCRTALSAAELPREDAEFLTREAARADFILKERDYYYERYTEAREGLEAHQRTIDGHYGASANTVAVP